MLNNIALLLIICILASLGSGLFFLFKDEGDSRRIVGSLTTRVILSLGLFVVVMLSFMERIGWLSF